MDPAMVADEVYSMRDARSLPRRVLIVRLGAMGDVLHALPAVHLIRQAIPKCEIGWVIESRWAPLLCAPGFPTAGETAPERPLVNAIHEVDTRAWRRFPTSRSTWTNVRTAFSGIRERRYEVAIDFQGAMKSAVVGALSGPNSVIGFRRPRESAARVFYSHSVDSEMRHVVDQNFALAREVAGDAVAPPKSLLPEDPAAETWVTDQFLKLELCKREINKFVIINPTAGWKAKEWPLEHFATVARELASHGFVSLINFGPGEEEIAQRLATASGHAAIPFACSLSQLIALTRRASLFIGGDTGPMHLAAALQVPVVALFGPTDPARNGPYSTRARVLRNAKSVTSYSHVAESDPGLLEITPKEVMDAAMSLLS